MVNKSDKALDETSRRHAEQAVIMLAFNPFRAFQQVFMHVGKEVRPVNEAALPVITPSQTTSLMRSKNLSAL